MAYKRKYSIFISSTYEDLKVERQAIMGVALENDFIPVGMEQFHAAPASQWDVITKMIDECDFYMLVIGGRYGSIDYEKQMSFTEKEYDYAKSKGIKVIVLIKDRSSITEDKKDMGEDKYDKMKRLDEFRNRVVNDGNTVDFFMDISSLQYKTSAALKNAIKYVDSTAGWVLFRDVVDIINEEAENRNKYKGGYQQKVIDDMKDMLSLFGSRLDEIENNQLIYDELPRVTKEEIDELFRVEGETLILGNRKNSKSIIGQDDMESIPLDSAILLVYAADGDGRIIKSHTLDPSVRISTSGKQFMADDSPKESARWMEALERLISWEWVRAVGYKGEIYELTETGFVKADWLKEGMGIDTSKEPIEVIKELDC